MVHNEFFRCKICDTPIRFRFQVGFFDVPIDTYCPTCNTHFTGSIKFNNNGLGFRYDITNLLKNDEGLNKGYTIELSTEFFQKKACVNKGLMPDLTPFLRFDMYDEKKQKKLKELLDYSKYTFEIGDKIENIYNLLRNKNIDLLNKFLLSENNKWANALREINPFSKLENYIDGFIASKHYLTTLLRNSMTDNISNEINDISKKLSNLIEVKLDAFKELIVFFNSENYFESYMEKIPKFICSFLKYFNHLIPVYLIFDDFSSQDLENYGITTASVSSLCELYKNGYEILCDLIDIIIALENIDIHDAYNDFGNGKENFKQKILSYRSKIIKYNQLLNKDSTFTNLFIDILDNRIRNSIAHTDYTINGLTQKIIFEDKYNGNIRSVEVYIAELVYKCINIYNAVLCLWEYYYQSHKLKLLIVDKFIPFYAINIAKNRS